MAPSFSGTLMTAFTVILLSLISHGAGLRFTQQDYESRSYSALLKGIHEFSIEETELLSGLPIEDLPLDEVTSLKKCSCTGNTCGCCLHVKLKKIGLDADVCLKVSYLPSELGVQVELTVDGKSVFRKEVSVKNPPAICAGVPGLKKMASLCIKFFNLNISGKQLSGCVELQARLAKVVVEKVKLGCFKVPPKIEVTGPEEFLLGSSNGFQIKNMHLSSEVQQVDQLVPETSLESSGKNCSCQKDSCQCCAQIAPQAEVCFKASLLPSEVGFQAEMSVNGSIILEKKVTTSNPPPICSDFSMEAALCLVFKNLHVADKKVDGCVDLDMRMSGKSVKKVNLGCFSIPPKDYEMSSENSLSEVNNNHQIEQMALPMNLKQSYKLSFEFIQESSSKTCSCQEDSCQCCAHLKVDKLHLNFQVCFKASFLPKEVGFQAEVTVGGKSIFKKKVTAQNPPPICGTLKGSTQLCLIFKNLHLSGKHLEGCAEVDVKLARMTVEKVSLGCFKIPPTEFDKRLEILKQLAPALVQTLMKASVGEDEAVPSFNNEFIQDSSSKTCSCQKDSCQCCAHLKVHKLHLDSQVCFKASFVPKEVGFQAEVTVDGKSIFKKKVTAQNPPPICGTLKKSTQLCLVFKNLHISGNQLEGCAEVGVKMAGVTVGKVSLGCFKIPPEEFDKRLELLKQLDSALVQTLMKASVEEDEAVLPSNNAEDFLQHKSCQSDKDSYSCCIDFHILGNKKSVCLKIVFLSSAPGVDLQLLYDGKVIFHQEVTVKDPPPFCVPLPIGGKKTKVSVCLKLKNIQLQKDYVSGCLEVDAKIEKLTVKKFNLGCFKIPPKDESDDLIGIPVNEGYWN